MDEDEFTADTRGLAIASLIMSQCILTWLRKREMISQYDLDFVYEIALQSAEQLQFLDPEDSSAVAARETIEQMMQAAIAHQSDD